MKTKTIFTAFVSTFCLLHSAFGQGALTPPGAPAPTMKSLAQIEPRTPISSAPYFIFTPGSYYLTTNLTVTSGGAIAITTNNVTLDLNGFSISSTASPAASTAILLSGTRVNVFIHDGHISSGVTNNGFGAFSGSGFVGGIDVSGPLAENIHVRDVSVTGVLQRGIYLGMDPSTLVESCHVRTAGLTGIGAASVFRCTAKDCGNEGILAKTVANSCASVGDAKAISAESASDCYGTNSGVSTAISVHVANNCVGNNTGVGRGIGTESAINCYGVSTGGTGIQATAANGCVGSSNTGNGLYAGTGVAIGCYASAYNGIALTASIANSCVIAGGTTNIDHKYNMP